MSFEGNVNTGIGVIFFVNIAIIILVLVITGVVWGCNKVTEIGLKGCVEAVWEGDSTATNAPAPASTNLNTMSGGTN